MSDDNPLGKAFLDSLRTEFPEEFGKNPQTLRKFLKEADQIVAIEENFLDNPDPSLESINNENTSE